MFRCEKELTLCMDAQHLLFNVAMPRMYRETPMDPVLLLWTRMAWPWSTIPLVQSEDVDLFKVMLNPGAVDSTTFEQSLFPLDLRISMWMVRRHCITVQGVGHREARAINAAGGQAYYYIWVGWNNQATQEQRKGVFILNLGVESSELCPDPEAGEPNNEQAQASFLPPGIEEIERYFVVRPMWTGISFNRNQRQR